MMDFDEPIQKIESSDDESINLTRLSGDEILKLAKGKYRLDSKRDGGYRTKRSILRVMIYFPMLLDPLFLYVPIINENIKCLALDERLKKIAIILRLFTDLPFLLNIIYQCRWWWYPLTSLKYLLELQSKSLKDSILAVLPIPQIVILIFLPTTRDSRSLTRMKILNSLILLQYVARARPVYTLCKDYNKGTREFSSNIPTKKKIWIPGVLNFISYILASHVLGAFWYFFSVQREIDCWISTCRSENGCDLSTLQCDNTKFRNVTLLNNLCPTNPPNPTAFNFGIFIDTLQSGIVGTTNFPQKFLMCFSWGLRNLSSFASNLNTSSYAWETSFVIFISSSGLLLFMYLLGHLQTFMQATSRTYRIWAIRKRSEVIIPRIDFMLSEYGLDRRINYVVLELVREALEQDEDRPTENIFSLLPWLLQYHLKRHLFLATLRKVPGLENINRVILEEIMEHLEPVNYADGSYIIREGEPLDRMFFITQGSVLTYKTSSIGGGSGSSSIIRLAKSEFYGEELIGWAAASTSFSFLPSSAKTVKSRNKVEVFVLMADHLQLVVSKFPTHFNTELPQPVDSTPLEISISQVA